VLIAAAEAAFVDFLSQIEATSLWHRRTHTLLTALSGGPDSLALALIAERVATAQNISHKALIIDHGLRDNSSEEASNIQAQMRIRGMSAEVLTITAPRPEAGHQQWARTHRLHLLAGVAHQKNACVLFAHHSGDQAETIAMRLARGSGLRGLAGISPLRQYQGALIARPFLTFNKQELIQLCHQLEEEYVTDPSNQNRVFERVRWRQTLAKAPQLAGHLQRLSTASQQLSHQLDAAVQNWIDKKVSFVARLSASCPYFVFAELPPEPRAAILAVLLKICGHYECGPTPSAVDAVVARLEAGHASTLAGCRISILQGGLRVEAEYGRHPADMVSLQGGNIQFFDGRWMVWASGSGQVRRLGDMGLSAKARRQLVLPKALSGLPYRLQVMIPVLQTLDDSCIPPHLKINSLSADTGQGGCSPESQKPDRHQFIIWQAPIDGVVRL
jgi:tRNA(Ile)-lysidine synthase